MSSDGTAGKKMEQELADLIAQSVRLREESEQLEERIRELAARCEQMQSKSSGKGTGKDS